MIVNLEYWTRVIKRLLIVFLVIVGVFLGIKLSVFYMPFLIAFVISLLLEPIIKYLKNSTSLNRKTSAILVMIIFSGIIVLLFSFGIVSLISEASDLLAGINEYYEKINETIHNFLYNSKFAKIQLPDTVKQLINTSSVEVLNFISNFFKNALNSVLNSLTAMPVFIIYIGVTFIAIYFMIADRIYILDEIEHHLPKLWVKKIASHVRELIDSLGSFLKAEVILVIISFFEVLVGLYIYKFIGLKIEYPLLMALLIGFVDALPILGSGTVMLPWALWVSINGDIKLAIAILSLWIIISVVRQLIEPKIVSAQIGIHPIFTLIAMYTGLKLIGIIGLIVGPIILIIFKNLFGTFIDNGVFKTIFDKK